MTRTTNALLALALFAGAGAASAQYVYYAPQPVYRSYAPPPAYAPAPPRAYNDSPSWEAAPAQFAAAEQRGYLDGIEGARKDYKNHRPPNVYNRDEYRNPHFISPPDRYDYQLGFRKGYNVAVRHIYGPL